MAVQSITQAEDSAHKSKFNELTNNPINQGDANNRLDSPKFSGVQRLMFGPNYPVIKAISPVKLSIIQKGDANLLPAEEEEL